MNQQTSKPVIRRPDGTIHPFYLNGDGLNTLLTLLGVESNEELEASAIDLKIPTLLPSYNNNNSFTVSNLVESKGSIVVFKFSVTNQDTTATTLNTLPLLNNELQEIPQNTLTVGKLYLGYFIDNKWVLLNQNVIKPQKGLIQSINKHITTPSVQSIIGVQWNSINEMELSITPKYSTSQIRVSFQWGGECYAEWDIVWGIERTLNGVTEMIGLPENVGNRSAGLTMATQTHVADNNDSTPEIAQYTLRDTPNTINEIIYKIKVKPTSTRNIYNNRTVEDYNNISGYERLTSSITLEEINI